MKFVAKVVFLSEVCPPITCGYVKQEAQRSSTLQEKGPTNEGMHHLLLLHKQVHDKRGIAESLHAYS